jgi:hypothetical protein
MYNLIGTVNFPTRITATSCSDIDNIFVDKRRSILITPYINALSDHDAQLLTINGLTHPVAKPIHCYIRDINKLTILDFLSLLSEENWECVFESSDVNIMFHLIIF